MNRTVLLTHFERISDAPDSIASLRRFVLDLAVRGKLVDQQPNDESSIELLKRLQVARQRLVQEGKIRRGNTAKISNGEDWPFSLPTSWVWCHLSEVGAIVGGGTPPSGDPDNFTVAGSGIPWLTPADLGKQSELYVSHGARDLTAQGLRSSSATMMPKGSVLFTSRAPIGYTAIAAAAVSTNQGFKSIVPFIPACGLYIAVYFRAFGKWIDGKASGTTFREVSGKVVANLPFPLPPLNEQQRIVSKVDELLELCERLAAAQMERRIRRGRLAAATLHQFSNGANAAGFGGHVGFYLHQLPRVTAHPDHIHALRRTILNLAVRGQLVPQDPADESASELLKRIEAAKARHVKDHALRKEKALPPVAADDAPFAVPANWTWARIGTASLLTEYGTSVKSEHAQDGVPVLTMGNIQGGQVVLGRRKMVPRHIEDLPQLFLKRFDLLYNRTNSAELVGKTGIYLGDDDAYTFASYLIRIRFLSDLTNPMYANLAMNAPYFRDTQIVPELQQQCGQANVNGSKLRHMMVPFPPLAEQHRIVAKVEELMALCDGLAAQLNVSEATSRLLLEAVLHQALDDDQAPTDLRKASNG